jgi:hypothetical protein
MNKSFAIVLSAFILLATTSCDLQKKRLQKCQKWGVCQSNEVTIIKDSIKVDTFLTDDSDIWLSMLFECDSSGNVLIKQIDSLTTKNADLQMALKENKVVIHGSVPGKVYRIPKLMRSVNTKSTVTVKVNELKWHQAARLWAFNIILIVAILLFGWKMLKLYIYKKLP